MKKKMWFQNMKIKLIVVGIIILVGFVIFLSICHGYARPVLQAILGWGGGSTAERLYALNTRSLRSQRTEFSLAVTEKRPSPLGARLATA
ncbi:unnamed protein product [Prunus armeniaca]